MGPRRAAERRRTSRARREADMMDVRVGMEGLLLVRCDRWGLSGAGEKERQSGRQAEAEAEAEAPPARARLVALRRMETAIEYRARYSYMNELLQVIPITKRGRINPTTSSPNPPCFFPAPRPSLALPTAWLCPPRTTWTVQASLLCFSNPGRTTSCLVRQYQAPPTATEGSAPPAPAHSVHRPVEGQAPRADSRW